MSDRNTTSTTGISFVGILFVAFLVLKLTHVIDWSWWWVTAPLWGGLAVGIVFVVIFISLSIILDLWKR